MLAKIYFDLDDLRSTHKGSVSKILGRVLRKCQFLTKIHIFAKTAKNCGETLPLMSIKNFALKIIFSK